MPVKTKSSRARVAVTINRLHQLPLLTVGEYFKSVDDKGLSSRERAAIRRNKNVNIHEMLIDNVTLKKPRQDFCVLMDIDRYPANNLELLLDLYFETFDS